MCSRSLCRLLYLFVPKEIGQEFCTTKHTRREGFEIHGPVQSANQLSSQEYYLFWNEAWDSWAMGGLEWRRKTKLGCSTVTVMRHAGAISRFEPVSAHHSEAGASRGPRYFRFLSNFAVAFADESSESEAISQAEQHPPSIFDRPSISHVPLPT